MPSRFAAWAAGVVALGDGVGVGEGDGEDVPVSEQEYDVEPLLVSAHVYVCVTPLESVHDHVHDDGGGPAGPWAPV